MSCQSVLLCVRLSHSQCSGNFKSSHKFFQVPPSPFKPFNGLSCPFKSFQVLLILPSSSKSFHVLSRPFRSFLVLSNPSKSFQVFQSPSKSLHIIQKQSWTIEVVRLFLIGPALIAWMTLSLGSSTYRFGIQLNVVEFCCNFKIYTLMH